MQVLPAPLLKKSTPSDGGDLPQAGEITLDRPVTDIQGCDFFSAQRLVWDAYQGEVLQVGLDRAPDDERGSALRLTFASRAFSVTDSPCEMAF
ncbi:hypothetical protein [Streptomyces sp. NPDC057557]|uniref:hypothetical protein n=1 Tax=Streptomyces sp. NPDC057557 TaxID=3346167 RepID=UPI0036979D6F